MPAENSPDGRPGQILRTPNAQLGYRSTQISRAVREFNTPMFEDATPNASDQYHSLRQEYQPANIIEFPPTLFDRALHVQCGDVRRKRSPSDPGPWAGEQAAKTLGKAVLPETICHQCPKGQTPFMNNVDDTTSLLNSNPANIVCSCLSMCRTNARLFTLVSVSGCSLPSTVSLSPSTYRYKLSSNFTTAPCPFWAARCSAVKLLLIFDSRPTPFCSSNSQTSLPNSRP